MKSLLLILSVCLSLSAFGYREREIWPDETTARYEKDIRDWQKIVRLNNRGAKNRLRSELASVGVEVVAEGAKFLAIRPAVNLSPTDYDKILAKLRKDSEVQSVTADRVQILRAHDSQPPPKTGNPGAVPVPVPNPPRPQEEPNCGIFPVCKNMNPAWPKFQVGADLAEEIVNKAVGKDEDRKKNAAKVAVIDSGFNMRHHKDSLKTVSTKTGKAIEKAGDPEQDREGHGTAVAGMVADKTVGMTSTVHLSLLRVTEEGAGNASTDGALAAAITAACKENDVVNVSLSGLGDEIGQNNDDLWMDEAQKAGCIVVKAAGNFGIKQKGAKPVTADNPKLLVSASDTFSDEANFSSIGGIYAPGEDIVSLLSLDRNDPKRSACTTFGEPNKFYGPMSGTSFAAPIVSGIAAQVVGILRARGALPADPKQKIKLVKNILMASAEWSKRAGSRQGVVNALNAALIANHIPKDKPDASIDELIAFGSDNDENVKRCEEKAPDLGGRACPEIKAKVTELRYRFYACFPPPKKGKGVPEVKQNLYNALKNYKQSDLIMQVTERLEPTDAIRKDLEKDLEKVWDHNLNPVVGANRKELVDAEYALQLMQVARRSGVGAKFNTGDRFRQIVDAPETPLLLGFMFPLGKWASQQKAEDFGRRYALALQSLSEADQLKIISELGGPLRPGIPNVQHELNLLYFLSENSDPFPPAVKARIASRLKEVGELWLNGKLVNTPFQYANFIPSYDKLFSAVPDAKAKLEKLIANPINPRNMSAYIYAIGSPTAMGDKRLALAEKALTDERSSVSPFYAQLGKTAMKALFEIGDVAAIKRTAQKALLDNPLLELPIIGITSATAPVNPAQEALAADGFFPKFFDVSVKRAVTRFQEKDPTYSKLFIPVVNTLNATLNNKNYPWEKQKEYFAGASGEDYTKLIELAANEFLKRDEFDPVKYPAQRAAFDVLRVVTYNKRWAEASGARARILKGLAPLVAAAKAAAVPPAKPPKPGEEPLDFDDKFPEGLLDQIDNFLSELK